MGTSQSQSSPRSASWDRVRGLYASGASPGDLAGAIANAIPDATLEAATRVPLCGLASAVAEARALEVEDSHAWLGDQLVRAADLGHDLTASLARAAALRSLTALAESAPSVAPDLTAGVFAAEYLAALFEYYVERDIPELIGGPRLATVGAASSLCEAVAAEARAAVMAQADAQAPPRGEAPAALVATLMLGAVATLRGRASLGA
jgi:hypothetical protein